MVTNILYEICVSYHDSKVYFGVDGGNAIFIEEFSENYAATMLQAADFSPTPHSKIMYNEAFRANQFLAAGIKPIFVFNDMFQVRSELYGFMPIFPIKRML